jgi:radical SAM-linked protein
MATIEYSLRRAGLPLELTEGFNPRPRMAIAIPLPLGYIGEREILEMNLRDCLDPNEIQQRLSASVPPGLTILSVEELHSGRKAASRVRGAEYRVHPAGPFPDAQDRIDDLLSHPSLPIEENRDGEIRHRDVRPLIAAIEPVDGDTSLRISVRFDPTGTVRPEEVLRLMAIDPAGAVIVREHIDLDE